MSDSGIARRYTDLTVGTPIPVTHQAFSVNGICRTCHTALSGTALTEAKAVQTLKKHFRSHVKAGHRKAPGQDQWLQPEEEAEE